MNEGYQSFIQFGRQLAVDRGINWEIRLSPDGSVKDEDAWNLTEMVGDSPPPTHWIRDLGTDKNTVEFLNTERRSTSQIPLEKSALSPAWQSFIKAAILEQLFFRKNSTGHVSAQVARALRVMATCISKEPWEILPEDISNAYEIAKKVQASGQLADQMIGLTKKIFDANHIADAGQLYPALASISRLHERNKRAKFTKSADELKASLEARKSAEKLPERRAFWELVRIVFTEQPKTFLDLLRFSQVKVMILCGLRVGEAALLPVDWKRTREYYDSDGKPAGEHGGYSKALMLRHFAEKQQMQNSDSVVLYETAQYVPSMFQEALADSLENVVQVTQPLRDTLRLQVENNRILPWFHKTALISVIELYPYLTGTPIVLHRDFIEPGFKEKYKRTFDPSIF